MLLSEIQQKQLHRFTGSFVLLQNMLSHLTGSVPEMIIPNKKLRVLNSVDISVDKNFATLEWTTTPENDMYADIVVQVLMKIQAMDHGDMKNVSSVPFTKYDHMHFKVKFKNPINVFSFSHLHFIII
jgi:cleavage and polyadenylation specificity factor subunit 3